MKCPRRFEPFCHDDGKDDAWKTRDGYRACSFCGCMHPDDLFAALEAGAMLIGTDKNYKAYVEIAHPQAGQRVQTGSESGPAFDQEGKPNKADLTWLEKLSGRYERKLFGIAPPTKRAKFYYQHLDDAGQDRFIELYNNHKINVEKRFGLYRTPYFAKSVRR